MGQSSDSARIEQAEREKKEKRVDEPLREIRYSFFRHSHVDVLAHAMIDGLRKLGIEVDVFTETKDEICFVVKRPGAAERT
jgi:hypothetical protein